MCTSSDRDHNCDHNLTQAYSLDVLREWLVNIELNIPGKNIVLYVLEILSKLQLSVRSNKLLYKRLAQPVAPLRVDPPLDGPAVLTGSS